MNPEMDNSDWRAKAEYHLNQAYLHYEEREEFEKALLECDAAIEIDPYLADAYNLRGIVLEELGRTLEAVAAYKQAIHLDPDLSIVILLFLGKAQGNSTKRIGGFKHRNYAIRHKKPIESGVKM